MTLPDEFVSYTRDLMGDGLFERFLQGLDSSPVVSVRFNPKKSVEGIEKRFPISDAVPWCKNGYYLESRPSFTFDPLLHAGAYYVQEASSMFIDEVVRQLLCTPVLMLDMCAAPGGKSTALRSALQEGSLLVCNEPIRPRAHILMENLQKWGHPDVVVTNDTPTSFRRSGIQFDVILTDVPCSGEGMFRKDVKAIEEWSIQNVLHCQQLQREIISNAWACLRPGGLLIYSTCTMNTRENEENIAWMMRELDAMPIEVSLSDNWGIKGSLLPSLSVPVYRFIPGIVRGEGLFMAVLRKDGERASFLNDSPDKKNRKNKKSAVQTHRKTLPVTEWLSNSDLYAFIEQGENVRAIPKKWLHIYEKLKNLRLLNAGVEVATIRGRDYVPCHALALSSSLRRDIFEEYAVSYDEAICYLRREAITLPSTINNGFALITYQGIPLGFVKHLGTRSNNLYPQEWKIISQLKSGG